MPKPTRCGGFGCTTQSYCIRVGVIFAPAPQLVGCITALYKVMLVQPFIHAAIRYGVDELHQTACAMTRVARFGQIYV